MWDFEKTKRELEKLTPGGSEFHDEPERCIKWIKDKIKNQHKRYVELKKEFIKLRNQRIREIS